MNSIYVLTGTGNSLAIAKELAEGLGSTEILSMGALMNRQSGWKIEGEMIGFVFPCYYGTAPRIVKQFISGADSISGKYIFAFVSSGGGAGYSLKHLDRILRSRNLRLDYGRSAILASNYMNGWYYSMILPDREQIQRNAERTSRICREAVQSLKKGIHSVEKGKFLNYLIPQVLSPDRYLKDTRPRDREFSIGGQCHGCGTCEKVCPVGNIEMKNGHPVFRHNCQRCMACIQFCPEQAFSIGGKPMNKERYRHPLVSLKELTAFHKEGKIAVL